MSDSAEEGIARVQAAAAQAKGAGGLKDHHTSTIASLDERIVVFVLAIAVIGLGVLWATTTSPLVRYGSLGVLILLTFLWGFVRIKRIDTLKRQRAELAESWQVDGRGTTGGQRRHDAD
jgi:Flp pilus assembly protein TadB